MVFIIPAVVIALLIIADVIIAVHFFGKSALRRKSSLKRTQGMTGVHWEQYDPERLKMIERLRNMPFTDCGLNSFDGTRLHARYIRSGNSEGKGDKKIVICFHGYTSSCIGNNTAIALFYLQQGFDVLLPDLRAHGESGGRHFGFGVLDRYDGLEWVKFLQNKYSAEDLSGRLQIYLYGVSMGGATVCMMSGLELPPCVKAVISDCAFTSPKELFARLLRYKYKLPAAVVLPVADILYRIFAKYSLNGGASDRAAAVTKLPMLLIHGAEDNFSPPEMCSKIYNACGSAKKEILMISGADHAEAYFKDRVTYESKVKAFLGL